MVHRLWWFIACAFAFRPVRAKSTEVVFLIGTRAFLNPVTPGRRQRICANARSYNLLRIETGNLSSHMRARKVDCSGGFWNIRIGGKLKQTEQHHRTHAPAPVAGAFLFPDLICFLASVVVQKFSSPLPRDLQENF